MREFIYNRHDPAHRLVSQGLRDQSAIDSLGLQKAKWLEEVHKKFNVLSLINFIFRECLDTEFAPNEDSEGLRDGERPQTGLASSATGQSNMKIGSQSIGQTNPGSRLNSGFGTFPGPAPLL